MGKVIFRIFMCIVSIVVIIFSISIFKWSCTDNKEYLGTKYINKTQEYVIVVSKDIEEIIVDDTSIEIQFINKSDLTEDDYKVSFYEGNVNDKDKKYFKITNSSSLKYQLLLVSAKGTNKTVKVYNVVLFKPFDQIISISIKGGPLNSEHISYQTNNFQEGFKVFETIKFKNNGQYELYDYVDGVLLKNNELYKFETYSNNGDDEKPSVTINDDRTIIVNGTTSGYIKCYSELYGGIIIPYEVE